MANSRPTANSVSEELPEEDVFLTVLYAPDHGSLVRQLRDEILDIGPMHVTPDSREVELHVYAQKEQIEKLKKFGWKLEVRQNLSAVGRERQKEVGKGDRFEGGKVRPKGLGMKTGGEN